VWAMPAHLNDWFAWSCWIRSCETQCRVVDTIGANNPTSC
jgi:hypothetical protein